MSMRLAHLKRWSSVVVVLVSTVVLVALAYQPSPPGDELPSRIPQPAPYDTREAKAFAPPFEERWETVHNPGRCATCHGQIFAEWNGSMMGNAWRDPGWRAAFLLAARQTSTTGDCAIPLPPDGTLRSHLNPFAEGCTSAFDTAAGRETMARPGSLLDGFCSQCHMPANYVDNVPLAGVGQTAGIEHAKLDPGFDPTSDAGTGLAFATLEPRFRNTDAGKRGVFCAVCHTMTDTREMPFGNVRKSGTPYPPTPPTPRADRPAVPDPAAPSQGYAIGAGAFRLSPHALGSAEYFGPLTAKEPASEPARPVDPYLSRTFGTEVPYQKGAFNGHAGYYQALHERAEMCAACHDVTNPLPVKNRLGRWVGGFPIERTYTEWAASRYADRPGNRSFDPRFKRDCQTCHMQQDYGQPGTAQTLYRDGRPVPPRAGRPSDDGPERPITFSHHFIGGNTYVPRLAGAAVDGGGAVQPYPELSVFSFSSADEKSLYHNAYFENAGARGPITQHARLAWDRLRNVLDLDLSAPREVSAGNSAPLHIAVTNSGSGHDFPSGFPEGRVAWVAVRAFDLATGSELPIRDSFWKRTTLGVGYLTHEDMADPNYLRCRAWKLPAGSPDPYAVQFKAIASLGDGCPTLDLAYAAPLNLVAGGEGRPPRFRDLDGDGELYDDAFLSDTRLRPLPHPGATATIDRYAVVVPPGVRGPVAVVAAVYYQSFEGIVAKKLLGNLADLDTDFRLEPCVLRGACDGRVPSVEPPVVEGAPPVPMEVRDWVIDVRGGAPDTTPPAVRTWPAGGAQGVAQDAVLKAFFSEPVTGVDVQSFTVTDGRGEPVPGFVDEVGDGAWAFFPHRTSLEPGRYTAHVAAGVCDLHHNCTREETAWTFAVSPDSVAADTRLPIGFPPAGPQTDTSPLTATVRPPDAGGRLSIAFSRPVLNVNRLTLRIDEGGAPVLGALSSNAVGDLWTFTPARPLRPGGRLRVTLSPEIYDLAGRGLAEPYRRWVG
jgi:hypothetical protein